MAKGIVKQIESLGRFDIPVEYRRILGFEKRQALDLHLQENTIHLSKGKGRKIDELGRFTIPKAVRSSLSFEERQSVDVYIEGDEICIRKEGCSWCNVNHDLIEIDGNKICILCAQKVQQRLFDISRRKGRA